MFPNSQYFVHLKSSFRITGPNGEHTCFVFDPKDPSLTRALLACEYQIGLPTDEVFYHRFPKSLAKWVLKEILFGLQFLHGNKVVHGDLHLANILVNSILSECNEDSIQRHGNSLDKKRPLKRRDGKKDLWAPSSLLSPEPLSECISTELDPCVQLADIGRGKYRILSSVAESTLDVGGQHFIMENRRMK